MFKPFSMASLWRPAIILSLLLSGCVTTPPLTETTVDSSAANATITIDQTPLGKAPVKFLFDFTSKTKYTVTAKAEGYFEKQVAVTSTTPGISEGRILIPLDASQAWAATAPSDAANKWLQIRVNPEFTSEHVWRRMVDSATARYLELEKLNYESGYLRSVYVAKKFPSPKGNFFVRTRFIAAITSQEPLIYKIKVTAEWAFPGGKWHPYGRIFKEDVAMVEDIRSRFGMM